jgi:hypothetical protein
MTTRHSPGLKAKGARAPDTRRDSRRPTRPQRLRYIYEEDEDSFDVPDTVLGSGEK